MKISTVLPALAAVIVFGAAPSAATSSPKDASRSSTPDSCIASNHGDWTACNVNNNGRGNLPYRPVTTDPVRACIERNRGDWTACNVR